MRALSCLFLAVAILFVGCATKQPDWISGKSTQYPDNRYLTGVGQADQRELAKDRARSDLAKIFAAQIQETTQDKSAFLSERKEKELRTEQRTEIERDIQVSTDRIVEGVEIAAVWRDKKLSQYHALAVLPRLKAANSLRQDIERLDEGTVRYLERARLEPDVLAKIGAAYQAVSAQRERLHLQQTLRVIDPTGVGMMPRWTLDTLEADLSVLARRLRIATLVGHDDWHILKSALDGSVAAAGFTVDTSTQAEYILTGNLALEDLGQREGWYWVTGALEIELKQSSDNSTRGRYRFPIKISAQQPQLSRKRVKDEVNRRLKTQLRDVLMTFAHHQSE